VSSQIFDLGTFGGRFHHVPDAFGVIRSPQILSIRLTRRKIAPAGDAGRGDPLINGAFRPNGNWNGTDVFSSSPHSPVF
jgi:hypothetical protein